MMRSLTFTEAIWPPVSTAPTPSDRLARNLTLMVCFSVFIGLCAHVQFRLATTPVPITGQTFGVLLTGALLGSRLGAATLVLYIAEGLLGFPVFAPGGTVASYGYLIGYPPAAFLIGMLAERGWDRKPLSTATMMLLGSVVIYIPGVCWLRQFAGSWHNAVAEGVAPFLVGDAVKAAAVAALLPTGWRLLGNREK